ncbi:MAG: DNA polymerase III subunit alpha [Bacteroidota bacterium]|nr:DNA polymerase III subunit alpha [Bacteroidota bacterium]
MYLNCKTYFSFRYGTFGTEELVSDAAALGISQLALTNINNTSDTWDFVEFSRQRQIRPIAGAEIRNDNKFLYILLAKNNPGFEQINRFLSEHLQGKKPFPDRPDLTGVYVIYSFGSIPLHGLQANEFMGVQTTDINKLFGQDAFYLHKLVVRQPVTFQNQQYYNAHRLLRAIDKNVLLSKQQKEDIAEKHETLVAPGELFQAFQRYPCIIANTRNVMESCSIEMDFHKDKTKKIFSASREDDRRLLQKLALYGLRKRYGIENKTARSRVMKELAIIDQMHFNAYFLITWDIIRYARSRGFFFVGRGSGANSIVAYCLQITDVDPIELDLYFERFLNPQRSVPPDFDLDFSWKGRDQIIDYVFKRYGREHVCLLGSYSTFQTQAILRELGKVFGLPKEEIDQLDSGNMQDDKIRRQIHFYGNLIHNFPNHLSIHAGGMLISDAPIYQYTATELPPKNFYTSQIDMFLAEKIGLFKLDILSQRGLGHIRETMEHVKQNQKININIHDIARFKQDPRMAARISKADTIGCFYIESPGMRQLLMKLECNDYLSLVAASSVIRPGVAQSGMMKQFIYRHHHPNDFEYLHPKMKELLEETFGIMVYQEDVIKVAHHFAGLDLAEADMLRRAISGKYRSRKQLEDIKIKFFKNCRERNYSGFVISEVWRQIESFGGYSFSKAHSASFAVESYQSLYLKTYFPMEFMVSVINNFGGFYSRELYFHELKKTGARIQLPCVNRSRYLSSISGFEVCMGFVHVQSLEEQFMTKLIEERERRGDYRHLNDFIERLSPGIEQLNILIRIGAFRFTGKNKKELLWEANFLHKKKESVSGSGFLFREEPVSFQLPDLAQHPLDDALDEIELLGFPLCPVFELVNEDPAHFLPSSELPAHLGKEVHILGYLVTSKSVNTVKNQPMHFHTFLDAYGDWLDTIFFPDVSIYYPVTGKGFYAMKGKVVEEFGVYSVEVKHSRKVGIKDRHAPPNTISEKVDRKWTGNVNSFTSF